jgi:hypothetical protein
MRVHRKACGFAEFQMIAPQWGESRTAMFLSAYRYITGGAGCP